MRRPNPIDPMDAGLRRRKMSQLREICRQFDIDITSPNSGKLFTKAQLVGIISRRLTKPLN